MKIRRAPGLSLPWVLAFVVLGVAFLRWQRLETTLSFSGRSEVVEVRTVSGHQTNWYLQGVEMTVDEVARTFTGQVEPGAGARVRFERVGCGQLTIDIEADRSGSPDSGYGEAVAVLSRSESTEIDGETFVDLKREEVRQFVGIVTPVEPNEDCHSSSVEMFPIHGHAKIGKVVGDVNRARVPILLEGRVSMLARSAIDSFSSSDEGRYEAGRIELEPGDAFSIQRPADPRDPGSGFVRVDDGPGLLVVYSARGEAGAVERLTGSPYRIRPSIWAVVSSDPFFQALLAAVTFFFAAFTVFSEYFRGSSEAPGASGVPGADEPLASEDMDEKATPDDESPAPP